MSNQLEANAGSIAALEGLLVTLLAKLPEDEIQRYLDSGLEVSDSLKERGYPDAAVEYRATVERFAKYVFDIKQSAPSTTASGLGFQAALSRLSSGH